MYLEALCWTAVEYDSGCRLGSHGWAEEAGANSGLQACRSVPCGRRLGMLLTSGDAARSDPAELCAGAGLERPPFFPGLEQFKCNGWDMQIFRLTIGKRGYSSRTCVCVEWGFNGTRSIRCPDVAPGMLKSEG